LGGKLKKGVVKTLFGGECVEPVLWTKRIFPKGCESVHKEGVNFCGDFWRGGSFRGRF